MEMLRDKGGVWGSWALGGLWRLYWVGELSCLMNKGKEHGFCGFRNSIFLCFLILKMKHKIVPMIEIVLNFNWKCLVAVWL